MKKVLREKAANIEALVTEREARSERPQWFGQCASGRPDQPAEFAAENVVAPLGEIQDSILALKPIFDMELGQSTGSGYAGNNLDELGATKEVIKYPSKFFKLKGSKGVDTLVYYCLLGDCPTKGKSLSACVNSRGNLRKHIKAQHTSYLDEFNRLCKELDQEKGWCSVKEEPTAESSSTQLALYHQQPSCTENSEILTQDAFDSYILEYLVQGLHPVYETAKDYFQNLVFGLAPGKKIQSQTFYRDQIKKDFATKRGLLKNYLALAPWVSTTADCWSTKGRQFLGVTVHWFDEKLERKSACLAIKPVYGSCDYQNIATKLEAIYEEFEISGKVVSTVTDNGINFEKDFKMYGLDATVLFPASTSTPDVSVRQDEKTPATECKTGLLQASPAQYEYCQSLVKGEDNKEDLLNGFSSAFSESDEDEFETDSELNKDSNLDELPSTSTKQHKNTSEHLRTIVHDEEPDFFISLTEIFQSSNSISLMFNLPTHRRCAFHTLNLIAKDDVLKKSDVVNLKLKSTVDSKIRQIAKCTRKNPGASHEIAKELGDLLARQNTSRWNFWFRAYKRMASLLTKRRSEIRTLFQHVDIPFFRPLEEEYLREFVQVMRPLADALDVLKPDDDASVAYLLPTLMVVLDEMTILETSGLKVCKNLPAAIKQAVNERFSGYFEDEELIIATILHPKFKVWWLPKEQRTGKINRLRELCECLQAQNEESENIISDSLFEETDDTQQHHDIPKRCKKDFFRSFNRGKQLASKSREVELYLADSDENVEALEKYPMLKRLFRRYNATLPSIAYCERLFGVTGRICSPVRSRLSDKNFEQLLFLKLNSKVLI